MSKFVYDDVSVTVNSVDLSDHVQSVTLSADITEVDVSTMGDTWDQSLPGRAKVTGSITFYQDFAASSVDATIWPLVNNGTTTITLRPTSATVGATNPDWDITNTVITSYQPVAGTYGDAAMVTLNFSGGTLAPATS